MKTKFPLQKFSKKTFAVVSISGVVAVSVGILKLVPTTLREPTRILEQVERSNPRLPDKEPELDQNTFSTNIRSDKKGEPEFDQNPYSAKIREVCEAVIYCKVTEEIFNNSTSEDDHLNQKKHLRLELNRILEDYKIWHKFGVAEAIANCIENKVTCDCFSSYLERHC